LPFTAAVTPNSSVGWRTDALGLLAGSFLLRWIPNWPCLSGIASGAICILLIAGLLDACWMPFHTPRNQVTWLSPRNGVGLGEAGTLIGSLPRSVRDARVASIEFWMDPDTLRLDATVLSFWRKDRQSALVVLQRGAALEVQYKDSSGWWTKVIRVNVRRVFEKRRREFVAIVLGERRVRIYVNDRLVANREGIPENDFLAGTLIVGNTPIGDDSWKGELHGLAVYARELDKEAVLRHYRTWSPGTRPVLEDVDRCAALYLLNETSGVIAHNQMDSGSDLAIPEQFTVLDKAVLRPVWMELTPEWWYWKDVLLNIGGFMPLGAALSAYLAAKGVARITWTAALFAGLLSFAIECGQVLLPTRDSSMTDIFTNTTGAILGSAWFLWARSNVARSREF
jgi:VanZ like family/Concanavalin A-like lectin/glucanases superfamily